MKVAVIGLGYVGLPLACLCARTGMNVIGFDVNEDTVRKVNSRKCPIKDNLTQEWLSESGDNLVATTNDSDLDQCTVYLLCVPTPVDIKKKPDLSPLHNASETVSRYLKQGDLVIVESTVYPGTCADVVMPILESSGLKAGADFFLAHCPERVNPGDVFWNTGNIPRVVGAITEEGSNKAAYFYKQILGGQIFNIRDIRKQLRPKFFQEDESYRINSMPMKSIVIMNSIKDAEAVKAMENTVRDVNIAFVNELAKISDALDLNVVDIIDGMSTKPFGKGPYFPGIGVGGHCIAVDPEWLKDASVKAGYFPEIIQKARDTNNNMPHYGINLMEEGIKKSGLQDPKIAVLGVSYKKNIDDPRESPFYEVKKILEKKRYEFNVYDPHFTEENTMDYDGLMKWANIVIIVTDHDHFTERLLTIPPNIKIVIDGRNCLSGDYGGVYYKGIGR